MCACAHVYIYVTQFFFLFWPQCFGIIESKRKKNTVKKKEHIMDWKGKRKEAHKWGKKKDVDVNTGTRRVH